MVYADTDKGTGLFFEAIAPDQLQIVDRWLGESDWIASTRRRSQRLPQSIQVRVSGKDATGARFDEETYTRTISMLGGLIPVSPPVDKGQQLVLMNVGTQARIECQVVYVGPSEGDCAPIGLTFLLPNPRFWNVVFPTDSAPAEDEEAADVDHEDQLRRVSQAIANEAARPNQRRSRVAVQIPVRLSWQEGRDRVSAEGNTVNVSAGGARLTVSRPAAIGQKITLLHSQTNQEIECYVRYVRQSESGAKSGQR